MSATAPLCSASDPGRVLRERSERLRAARRGMRGASRAWQRYRRTATAHSKTLEVREIRIGGEADAALFSVTGLEGEGRVARDLICELIVILVGRRELLPVKRCDEDVCGAFLKLNGGILEG